MQDRKEYILEKAFEVFMAKGYDSASMTVLQQELKMSRGAMYRYFDSKDDLFKAVIDQYIFGLLEMMMPRFKDDDITVIERIELTYQHLQAICNYFDKIENMDIKFLNYTALVIQAAKRYPGFLEKLKKYKTQAADSWKKAINNSIRKGEVRKDVDVEIMAQIFVKSFDVIDKTDNQSKSFCYNNNEGKKIMLYIYSLIKV